MKSDNTKGEVIFKSVNHYNISLSWKKEVTRILFVIFDVRGDYFIL